MDGDKGVDKILAQMQLLTEIHSELAQEPERLELEDGDYDD